MRRRGATLIEIVVVMVILLALASILTVVLIRTKGSSNAIACISNLRQIDLSYRMYAADYDDRTPLVPHSAKKRAVWKNALLPYARSENIFYCPADIWAQRQRFDVPVNHDQSLFTSYTFWINSSAIRATDGGTYFVLSAVRNPSESRHMTDYTAKDPRVLLHDEIGPYFPNYSPHSETWSVLYWDGHARHQDNPRFDLLNRVSEE